MKETQFHMKASTEQKETIREMADKNQMAMSVYIWHLVLKDVRESKGK